VAVGGEYARDAFGDGFGVIARQDDDPDSLDFRCRAGSGSGEGAGWS
jgi:hypothetical protein